MAQTYTATANTDGWVLTATNVNGRTTYTLKEPNGETVYSGTNPTSDIRVDSSLTSYNKELLAPFGAKNFTGLSINGEKNYYVGASAKVSTLMAGLSQMVQATNTDIKQQQTATATTRPEPIAVTPDTFNPVATPTTPIPTTSPVVTTRAEPIAVTPDNYNPTALPPPPPPPILNTKPEPISVTADVDPITGRTEPISVTSGNIGIDIDDGPLITGPITTTDPGNHLPLGDEIYDIYDPNLTLEQVASLSAEDQEVRAEVLAAIESGSTGTVGEDGEIVVTAPTEPPQPTSLELYDDWRVRLSLAPSAEYLYRAEDPGILAPLLQTNGVIFPYTPTISVNYAANYEQSTIIHSNYRVYQYSNSAVDNVSITCEFTAQDTREANYLLAVIHFFRSVTKMFFGQDEYPRAGTPPPLCYLSGMGNYQFSEHPMAITGFNYTLPNDVDYIKTVGPSISGTLLPAAPISSGRLPGNILPGGRPAPPDFTQLSASPFEDNVVTWVPTKIQLSITGVPIVSRNQMSQVFSLKDYATGSLLNIRNSPDGGFW